MNPRLLNSQDQDVPSRMAIEMTNATEPGTWMTMVGMLREPMKPSCQVSRI